MADKSVRYTPEFKRQMVELARTGRSPASLAKEFGPLTVLDRLSAFRAAETSVEASTATVKSVARTARPAAQRRSPSPSGH